MQVHHNQNDASKEVLQNAFSDSGTNECKYTDEISHLLALPLECNFGGDVIPANSIFHTVRRCNTLLSTSSCTRAGWAARYHRWYTLLDIASAAAHSPIDLKEVDPDTLQTKAEKERQCVDYHYSIHSSHVYYGGGSVNAILPSCNFIIPKPQLSSWRVLEKIIVGMM